MSTPRDISPVYKNVGFESMKGRGEGVICRCKRSMARGDTFLRQRYAQICRLVWWYVNECPPPLFVRSRACRGYARDWYTPICVRASSCGVLLNSVVAAVGQGGYKRQGR